MGDGDDYRHRISRITKKQAERMGIYKDMDNLTRTTMGGYERITYKEVVNGVTIIRTRWRRKKTKEKYRRT